MEDDLEAEAYDEDFEDYGESAHDESSHISDKRAAAQKRVIRNQLVDIETSPVKMPGIDNLHRTAKQVQEAQDNEETEAVKVI